jgi:hypothetical protein
MKCCGVRDEISACPKRDCSSTREERGRVCRMCVEMSVKQSGKLAGARADLSVTRTGKQVGKLLVQLARIH